MAKKNSQKNELMQERLKALEPARMEAFKRDPKNAFETHLEVCATLEPAMITSMRWVYTIAERKDAMARFAQDGYTLAAHYEDEATRAKVFVWVKCADGISVDDVLRVLDDPSGWVVTNVTLARTGVAL